MFSITVLYSVVDDFRGLIIFLRKEHNSIPFKISEKYDSKYVYTLESGPGPITKSWCMHPFEEYKFSVHPKKLFIIK